MNKIGIRVLSILIIASVFIVSSAMVVNAAPPQRIFLRITDIQDGEIQVSFNWSKLGAWKYRVDFRKDGSQVLGNSGVLPFASRTPEYSGSYNYTNSAITCGHSYTARIILYNKSGRVVKHSITQWTDQLDCPPPSCIFYEDFTGVSLYSLPGGWVTNNSDIVYAWNTPFAGGSAPELLLWYGSPANATHDYWARTPTINATAATTALNLSFKHLLYPRDEWANNFTYSVEVSTDSGSNWTAVLEGTLTESQYPDPLVGPETVNIDLSAYGGNNILIRWRLMGYTYYSDGWFIDDICVDGY